MSDNDDALYPTKWSEYVGQDLLKERIRIAAKSARIRKDRCEHILITGPAGTGKTALAKLAAAEMKTPVIEISGRISTSEVRRTWAQVQPRTVFNWDEFHRAVEGGKRQAEWMLHVLQDGHLLGPFGPEPLPPLTVFAATTDPQLLPETILSRFLRFQMEPYTEAEATKIALVMAKKVLQRAGLPLPSKDNARTLAQAGNCNPRAMRLLLLTLRDTAVVHRSIWTGSRYHLDEVLRYAGVTSDGLDSLAQRYLTVLLREFLAGAGAATLKDRLGEPDLSATERVLVEKGYVRKTQKGRILTAAGITRAESLSSSGRAA